MILNFLITIRNFYSKKIRTKLITFFLNFVKQKHTSVWHDFSDDFFNGQISTSEGLARKPRLENRGNYPLLQGPFFGPSKQKNNTVGD